MKGAGNVRDILKIGKLGWWEWFSSKGSLFCHSGSDFACCLSNQGPCFSYDSYDAVFIPLGALENKKQSSSSMHFGLDNLLWVPSNLKNSMILWIDEGILDVFCAVCICSPSLLMPSRPYGILGTRAFALIFGAWNTWTDLALSLPRAVLSWEQQDHTKDQILFVEGLHFLPNMWHGLVSSTYRINLWQDRHLTVA